jgi:hypothetical protein
MSDQIQTDGTGAAEAGRIDYPVPFDSVAVALCAAARRHISILSPCLDHQVFDNSELVSAISALARRGPESSIRILVSNPTPIVQRGHRLLELARRLPSSVTLQKLAEHPSWQGECLVICDRDSLLMKPGDSEHQAIYAPDDRAQTAQYLDLFNELWRRSSADINFRSLSL